VRVTIACYRNLKPPQPETNSHHPTPSPSKEEGRGEGTNTRHVNVLFVCMGNICRSPTAHGVFQKLVKEQSLHHLIGVDSAGTYALKAGNPPDPRARTAAARRGYDLSKIRARKVNNSDLSKFDYLLAMDKENKRDLLELCEEKEKTKVKLFLDFAENLKITEVPDPYYGGPKGFEVVLDMAEEACRGLLEYIKARHAMA